MTPEPATTATARWPDVADQILGGDQAVALAHVTPARGVVLSPLTNFGLRDRAAGTLTLNSSIGMWLKLERMRRSPQVAVAFHTRDHALVDRPEYVLVQGRASVSSPDDPDAWLEALGDRWERFGGQPREVGPLWEWWMRVYHHRVSIEITAERVIVWPDLECRGTPEVHGARWPTEAPAPQRPPARGTGPRIAHGRAARRVRRLPHVLLGWVGADGFPVVVPAGVGDAGERGIGLSPPAGIAPRGGRRAGLLAHRFARYVHGQRQRRYTGWLEAAEGQEVVYAPHTERGYWFPRSVLIYRLVAGYGTRRGLRQARRAGHHD